MIANEAYWIQQIASHLAGETTQEESARLQEWKEASEENLKLFEECELLWGETKVPVAGELSDIDERWQQLEQQIGQEDPASAAPRRRRLLVRLTAVAAVALLLILGYRELNRPVELPRIVAVASAESDATRLDLPDGSVVWLRKGSEIGYAEAFEERSMTLTGEAYFEVAHDPDRPFTVRTGQTITRVLGTKFHLKEMDSGDVELHVVEGKVAFYQEAAPDDQEILVREQTAVAELSQQRIARLDGAPDLNALSWQSGRLTFNHEPLARVVQDLEGHFGVGIVFENPGIARCELKTDFQNATLAEVLETICFSLNCSYTMDNGVYYIKGEPCNSQE